MSYVVLARRYRPQVFADLVGQEHVTLTLKNAILQERTAHAYLFTGPRGVGKTSAARILAKALRCLARLPDGEPCNSCEACTSITDGSSMDVLEIDAASNTGVDNIRNLRDTVNYMAAVGKYRVYIIDEVHMLSVAAFNALLKTLEEPPPHVVFIFATTETHKVLATIQSRCQRFDFKKIKADVMEAKLRGICQVEKIEIDEASLRALVVESEGCLRDAESLLDQAITLCGKSIRIEMLTEALALLDRRSFIALLESIGAHNPAEALALCGQIADKGADPKILLARLVDFYSDLHYFVFTKSSRLKDPDFDALMQKLSSLLSLDEIIRGLDLTLKTQSQLGNVLNTRITLESLVAKLCLQRPVMTSTNTVAKAPMEQSRATFSNTPNPPSYPNPPAQNQTPSYPAPTMPRAAGPARDTFAAFIRSNKPAWTPVLGSLLSLEVQNGVAEAKVKSDFAGKRLASNDGIEVLKTALGVARAVVHFESPTEPHADAAAGHHERSMMKHSQAKEHEAVQAAISIFGAVITDTKVLEDTPKKGGRS